MSKFNRYLIFFILFIGSIFGVTWKYLQTEDFGNLVSEKIAEAARKNSNFDINFEKIEIKMFPPATVLQNVRITRTKREGEFVQAKRLGFYFSILDLFSNKLSINEVLVEGGELFLKKVKKSEKNIDFKKWLEEDLFSLINNILINVLPNAPVKVKHFKMHEFLVQSGSNSLYINNLETTIYKSIIEVNSSLKNIQLNDIMDKEFMPDSVSVRLEISNKKIQFKDLIIKRKLETFEGNLEVAKYDEGLKFNSNLLYQGNISFIFDALNLDLDISGYLNSQVSVYGTFDDPQVHFEIESNQLRSPYANADVLNIKGDIKDEVIGVETLEVSQDGGSVSLLKRSELFNLKTNQLIFKKAPLRVKNIHTNDALFSIKDVMENFKGRLSGELDLEYKNEIIHFNMNKGFELSQFTLDFGDEYPLLRNPKINFDDSSVKLFSNLEVGLDVDINFKGSRVKANGIIGQDGISIKSDVAHIDLLEFGPISNFQIKGVNTLNLAIEGPYEDVRFIFDSSVENFSLLDLNFGKTEGLIEFHLKDNYLTASNLKSEYQDSRFITEGFLDFKNNKINLDINFKKASYQDTLFILKGITKDLDFLNHEEIELDFVSDLTIRGGFFDVSQLIVDGKIKEANGSIFFEEIDNLELDYLFKDKTLALNGIELRKGNGNIKGRFFIDTETNYFEYEGKSNGIKLVDFNFYELLGLGYNGNLFFEYSGNGILTDFTSKLEGRITNTVIGNKNVGGTSFNLYTSAKDIYFDAQSLNKAISAKGFINLDKKVNKKSNIEFSVDSNDLKLLLGAASARNIRKTSLNGFVKGSMKSNFDYYNWREMDLIAKIDKFYFSEKRATLRLDDRIPNKIELKKGNIKTWNLATIGNQYYLTNTGNGNLKKGYKLQFDYRLPAIFLEYWGTLFESASGDIQGRGVLIEGNNGLENYVEVNGREIDLRIAKIPVPISNISFASILEGNSILIKNYRGEIGSGDIRGNGKIKLELPFPQVKIQGDVNSINVPVLKRSAVTLKGELEVHGNELPYKVSGGLSILHGEINDEINDFDSNNDLDYVSKYLPDRSDNLDREMLIFDLDVDVFKPLLVKNSFSDMKFTGAMRVFGNLFNPHLNGSLNVVPGQGKFVFKGHEFNLTEGDIFFRDNKNKQPMGLNFTGVAQVNEYQVKLGVTGEADSSAFTIESSPPLSQEDILSLLTIGITSDVSKELSEEQRQSVTTVGIGTLLVDQFKLNEGLNSTLGLKVSVAPEYSKDETSLLQGKSGVSDGSTSTVKSSTKVKLQKKLHKNVDLSVSSTVGGTIEEKQEMNLKLKLNDNFSFDAIYEVKNSDDTTEEAGDSAGFDFKYRRTY